MELDIHLNRDIILIEPFYSLLSHINYASYWNNLEMVIEKQSIDNVLTVKSTELSIRPLLIKLQYSLGNSLRKASD